VFVGCGHLPRHAASAYLLEIDWLLDAPHGPSTTGVSCTRREPHGKLVTRRRTATGKAARPSNLASPARCPASACSGLRPRSAPFLAPWLGGSNISGSYGRVLRPPQGGAGRGVTAKQSRGSAARLWLGSEPTIKYAAGGPSAATPTRGRPRSPSDGRGSCPRCPPGLLKEQPRFSTG
jgi:hypothetical protein